MDAVGKKHLLGINHKMLKFRNQPVTRIIPDNPFQSLPDFQVVFIILVPKNIPPGQCRTTQIIYKNPFPGTQRFKSRYLIPQYFYIIKLFRLPNKFFFHNLNFSGFV